MPIELEAKVPVATQLPRACDPDLLRRQVWSEPLRQVAHLYGISAVALAKRCKRMNIRCLVVDIGQREKASCSKRSHRRCTPPLLPFALPAACA